jgi:hypothetical protein
LDVKNTRNLVDSTQLRWKVLIIGRPGVGKTSWLSTVPDIGVVACETGHGSGLLSVAHSGIEFVEPKNFIDFRSVCLDTFAPFQKKHAVGLDSLTAMTKNFIKDHVLSSFPSKNPREAMRRTAGVMSGFDYGDLAEVTRNLLNYLLAQNKHVVVTCLEKTEKDDNGIVTAIGPDLPGALGTSAAAMFDSVLYLKIRRMLRDPRDPKSAYFERYFITNGDGIHVSKDRNSVNSKPFLAQEEIFSPTEGRGTFADLFAKILAGHDAASQAAKTASTL